jgi:hypothetical protein
VCLAPSFVGLVTCSPFPRRLAMGPFSASSFLHSSPWPTARAPNHCAGRRGKPPRERLCGSGVNGVDVQEMKPDLATQSSLLASQSSFLASLSSDFKRITSFNKPHVVGGSPDGAGTFLNTVERFDGSRWTSAPAMATPRGFLGAAAFNGLLYAVWGLNGGALNGVEKFDGSTWAGASSMAEAQSFVRVAVFAGLLFAVGGTPDNGGATFSSVEMFDGSSWTSEPSLVAKRYGPGVAVFNGLLRAVGGHDASTTGTEQHGSSQ